jgi:hypothetical protein
MRILAVITDPAEVKKILRHLIKIGRPPRGRQPFRQKRREPPGLDPASLN